MTFHKNFPLDILSGEENVRNQDQAGGGSSLENPKPNKSKKKPSPRKGDSLEDPSDQNPGKRGSLDKNKGSLEDPSDQNPGKRGSLDKNKGSLEEASDQNPRKRGSLDKNKGSLEEAKGSLEEKTPKKKYSDLGSLESLDNGPQSVS